MATLATFFKRNATFVVSGEAVEPVRAQSDPFRLRSIPGDDIFFYAKRIDNSRIVRQADPAARRESWSAVGVAAMVLLVAGLIFTPKAGSTIAGYELESLRRTHQALLDQQRDLEVREAALLSPSRLNELASERQLRSPEAGRVVHLETVAPASVASNLVPAEPGAGAR